MFPSLRKIVPTLRIPQFLLNFCCKYIRESKLEFILAVNSNSLCK